MKAWKKILHANGNQKKAEVSILISDKVDFRTETIIRDKEGLYIDIMIKGSVQQEDITFVNIYAPNREAPRYIKQILTDLKGERDSNTITVGYFNNPLSTMARSSKQKIIRKYWT